MARRRADAAANFGDDLANCGCSRRVCGGELLPHRGRCEFHQFEQILARKIMTRADMDGEHIVPDGALHERLEGRIGKARAIVLRDRAYHLAVTALDQYVGDMLAQGAALRDSEQVLLAVRCRGCLQIIIIEPRRMAQHGLCDRDLVIAGECAHDSDGGIRDAREAA